MFIVMTVITGLALVVGLWLAITGFRGRRVPGTEVCADCGFDVLALTQSERPAARCPECGAAVLRIKGVKAARARSMRRGIAGTLLALVAGSGIALSQFAGITPTRALPIAVLRWQLASGDAAMRDAATRELDARHQRGELNTSNLQSIAPALLQLQGDRTLTWQEQWGLLLEAAHNASALTPQQQKTYLAQAVDIKVRHRAIARKGEMLQVGLDVPRVRTGSLGLQCVLIVPPSKFFEPSKYESYGLSPASDGGVQIPIDVSSTTPILAYGMSATLVVVAPIGVHEAQHDLRVEIAAPGWSSATTTITRTTKLEVVDRAGPFATALSNPMPATEVAKKFAFSHRNGQAMMGMGTTPGIAVTWSGSSRGVQEPVISTNCTISASSQPLAFEAFLRRAGDESAPWVPFMTCRSNHDSNIPLSIGTMMTPAPMDVLGADRVDVLLRGSAEVADNAIDMPEYWPGEVLIRDVPLERRPLINALTPSPTLPESRELLRRIELMQVALRETPNDIRWSSEVEWLLERQESAKNEWTVGDGEFFEFLHRRKLVSAEQYERYVRRVVPPFALSLRPRIRLADDGSFQITGRTFAYRCGERTDLSIVWDPAIVTLNSEVVATNAEPRVRYVPDAQSQINSSTYFAIWPIVARPVQPAGLYTLTVRMPYRVYKGKWTPETIAQAGEPVVSSSREASVEVRLLGQDEPVVVPVEHDGVARVLDSSLTCESVWYNFGDERQAGFGGLRVVADALPIAVGFDAFIRARGDTDRGNWWHAGRLTLGPGEQYKAGSGDNMQHRTLPLRNALPESVRSALLASDVEVVLIANAAAGESRTDVSEAWRGDGKERVLGVPAEKIRSYGR